MRLRDKVANCVACGLFAVSLSAVAAAQGGQQTAARGPQSAGAAAPALVEAASVELPDSPGAVQAGLRGSSRLDSSQSGASDPAQTSTSSTSLDSSTQTQAAPAAAEQDVKPQRPVGTAAAEAPVVSGVTAAQPSGVAIAPGKQHRARTIMIRVGAVVGAGVAIGSVAALTAGTSSKPPGAH